MVAAPSRPSSNVSFANGFATVHGPDDVSVLDQTSLADFVSGHAAIQAISSHHLRYPKPILPNTIIFDCCFLTASAGSPSIAVFVFSADRFRRSFMPFGPPGTSAVFFQEADGQRAASGEQRPGDDAGAGRGLHAAGGYCRRGSGRGRGREDGDSRAGGKVRREPGCGGVFPEAGIPASEAGLPSAKRQPSVRRKPGRSSGMAQAFLGLGLVRHARAA